MMINLMMTKLMSFSFFFKMTQGGYAMDGGVVLFDSRLE